MHKRDNLIGIFLLLPALILLGILIIYPVINAFNLSFHSQLIYEISGRFVGLKNYIKIITDSDFLNSLRLSFLWTFTTVIVQLILGIIAALLLNEQFKGRSIARALILLPFFMPTVSVTLMWKWIFNESYGIVNGLLMSMNLVDEPVSWLSSSMAIWTVIAIGIWRFFPFVVINVLARLQTIMPQLYEAAKVDGANFFQEFRYITWPEIRGVVFVVFLLRWIFMFKKFDIIYMMTNGGPGTTTEVLPILAYRYAFEGMQLGRGSAVSLLIFLITLVMIFIYLKFFVTKEEL